MSLFPVPVSGQKIPRGWFARLVRFVNSLVLRGDGSYLAVTHTPDGTFIKPTPYLIDRLAQSGRAASGGIGFPDLTAAPTAVDTNQTYDLVNNVWLIGRVQCASYGADVGSFYLNVATNGITRQIELFHVDNSAQGYQLYFENFICLPLRSGLSISFTRGILAITSSLSLYPSI